MATREKKVVVLWIGGFALILILLLMVLARYTSYQFTEAHRNLREISETESRLMETVTRLTQSQFRQQLTIEKIFRIGRNVREGAEGELLRQRALFEKHGKAAEVAIQFGKKVTENAQTMSAEASDKYMYIYNLLDGLQSEHQEFETDASAIIELIRELKFDEAQQEFRNIEETGRLVTDHANMILLRVEDFIHQSVRSLEEQSSNASWVTTLITAAETLIALIFAFLVLIYMLRYIRDLKKTEEALRKHEHELEDMVRSRTADLQKSNEELAGLKEKYEELYYDAPVGYHEIDREGTIVRVNNTEAQMLGYEIDEMKGRPIFDFVAPEERENSQQSVKAKISGLMKIKPFDRLLIRKDGKTVPSHMEEKIIKDRKGKITGMRTTVRDFSFRKKAEEELHRIKEAYQELYDDAPVGYHDIDTAGKIRRVNKTEAEMLGFSVDEMIGRPVFDFIAPEDREPAREAVRAKMAGTMQIKPFTRNYIRKDESVISLFIREKLIKDKTGAITGIRSTVQEADDHS